MLFSFSAFLVALAVVSSSAAGIEDGPVQGLFSEKLIAGVRAGTEDDISELVDIALANVRALISSLPELNRIVLPNATIEFNEVIVGIPFTGVIGLYNGLLTGLHTLHRTGNARFTQETNQDIFIEVEVGLYDLALEYSLVLQFFGIGPRATVNGQLSQVSIDFAIRLGTDSKIKVERVQVKAPGMLRIKVTGLGFILNFVADLIANVLGNLIKNTVVEVIQGPLLDIINAIIGGLIPGTAAFDDVILGATSYVAGNGQPTHHVINLNNFHKNDY